MGFGRSIRHSRGRGNLGSMGIIPIFSNHAHHSSISCIPCVLRTRPLRFAKGRLFLPPTSSSFLLAAILTTNISSFPSFGILSILVQSAPACTKPSPLMPKGELKGV